jgi:hypothetical protein
MNEELLSLYEADRQERVNQPRVGTPEYLLMRARDLKRRERVMELVEDNQLRAGEDFYHAAWIMNHGDTPNDARHAHLLSLLAHKSGYRPARWLAAASLDRWLMYQGKPQKYGTNYLFDGQRDRLWDVDPQTTDEERAEWDVPPLAEQLRKAEEANRHKTPLTPDELREYEAIAPTWFKEILKRWRAQENDPDELSSGTSP